VAKIVYGVAGEGSGHSSRAREIITHLEGGGHRVRVVTYGQGVENLGDDFTVTAVEGLHFATAENRVSVIRTLVENLSRLPEGSRKAAAVRKLFKSFRPDCVITDFEPITAYLAAHYNLPLVTIDNQHRMRYMKYPCPRNLRKDALAAETIIRAIVPRPSVSLVTTFYYGEVSNSRTLLFPPILRKEVTSLKPSTGKNVIVYLTRGFDALLRQLPRFTRENFIVYGDKGAVRSGNIRYKERSRLGFLKDLSECRAVIGTAGFTLITESLHLGKPYLALPMRGQFEQELNGLLLAASGYGKNCRRTTEEAVGDFLYRLPDYRKKLGEYRSEDNSAIKKKLDELLTDGCSLAREFHAARNS